MYENVHQMKCSCECDIVGALTNCKKMPQTPTAAVWTKMCIMECVYVCVRRKSASCSNENHSSPHNMTCFFFVACVFGSVGSFTLDRVHCEGKFNFGHVSGAATGMSLGMSELYVRNFGACTHIHTTLGSNHVRRPVNRVSKSPDMFAPA